MTSRVHTPEPELWRLNSHTNSICRQRLLLHEGGIVQTPFVVQSVLYKYVDDSTRLFHVQKKSLNAVHIRSGISTLEEKKPDKDSSDHHSALSRDGDE